MNTAPFPVIERQVTPGYSGSQYPKHCVNKPSVILGDSSPLASLSWQMGFKQRPYFIIYVMSVMGSIHFSFPCLSRCFPFHHNSFALCRRYLADLERWYGRFIANNNVSLFEARKMLTTGQLEEFKWNVDQYIKIGQQAILFPEWLKKLESASARFHISRLEAVQMQIKQ